MKLKGRISQTYERTVKKRAEKVSYILQKTPTDYILRTNRSTPQVPKTDHTLGTSCKQL